jgi:signal transduction histidine kinase
VLTRHLLFKLLAPTVLVCLLLVATCSAGVLYLNQLHVAISRALTENVESTLAADRLDRTITEMLHQLRNGATNHGSRTLANQLTEEIAQADEQLQDIRRLANLDQESQHADQIANGLQFYRELWKERGKQPTGQLKQFDLELAHRLDDREQGALSACRALRHYNTEQVKAADRQNSLLVSRLTWALLAVGVGAPLSGLLLGYATARSLYQSIYQLSVRIRDAAGRLKGELDPVTLEDLGDPGDLHHQMQGVIREIERVVERLQQREREVLRAEQLAAVGQVAAGVAHELRNPLTSVKMLVQAGLEGPEPAGLPLEDLGIIEHEVRRMEACIQTFLDFARPPTSERRCADLLAVVRRALALLEGRARRQKVTLSADLPPGPIELSIDPEQIHQVLLNLLLNALDALPHGGEVRLEVAGPTPAAQAVRVRIRDTGPGIAARIRERLFEPFVSSKETGLGLGLSICRRLIEAHGGTIQGDNSPEKGAVFEFTLPVATEKSADGP